MDNVSNKVMNLFKKNGQASAQGAVSSEQAGFAHRKHEADRSGHTDAHFDAEPPRNTIPVTANDRASQELLLAVEHFIRDREVLKLTNANYQKEIEYLQTKVQRLQQEDGGLKYALREKEEEIREVEGKLVQKQLHYDQLLEEYKELQAMTTAEIKGLKSENGIEKNKYVSLNEEFRSFRAKADRAQLQLEEKLRELDAANKDLQEKYQAALKENAKLIHNISHFTKQFDFSSLQDYKAVGLSEPQLVSVKDKD